MCKMDLTMKSSFNLFPSHLILLGYNRIRFDWASVVVVPSYSVAKLSRSNSPHLNGWICIFVISLFSLHITSIKQTFLNYYLQLMVIFVFFACCYHIFTTYVTIRNWQISLKHIILLYETIRLLLLWYRNYFELRNTKIRVNNW